jgi:hypothetical protein
MRLKPTIFMLDLRIIYTHFRQQDRHGIPCSGKLKDAGRESLDECINNLKKG